MTDLIGTPLTSPLYPRPPYHYLDANLFLALFTATEESLQAMLPDPLRPSEMQLAGLLFAEQPCKEAGTFMESAIIVQCMFDNPESGEEEIGVYFANGFVDTDVALAAGREFWGYPRKLANIALNWDGDTLTATTARGGKTLLKAVCTFTDEGEWIDSGPNVNVKLIPKANGEGYDLAQLVVADLKYDIKSGRSGDVEIELADGPNDKMTAIKIESPMIGLYFITDITVPLARAIIPLDM